MAGTRDQLICCLSCWSGQGQKAGVEMMLCPPHSLSAPATPWAGLSPGTRHIKEEWKPRGLNARRGTFRVKPGQRTAICSAESEKTL